MSTRSLQRIGTAGLAVLTMVGLLSGCAAKKKTAASPAAATSSAAAAAGASAAGASAIAATPSPTKVTATGGGKFCQQVAAEVNNSAAKQAASGSGTDSLKTSVQDFKSLEGSVLKSAPGAIKADLVTLFGALDKFYTALAAANYDFTKIDPSVEAPLQTPAVVAAEGRVDSYLKNTCGIDTGDDQSDNSAAEASASAALASALAKLTASPSS